MSETKTVPSPAPPGAMGARVARAAGWVALARLASQGSQFLGGLVLARILTPEDFGLLAGVYVITGFAMLFFDLGLGAALVQMRDPTDEDFSTAFWVNALGGIVFAALLAAAAPAVAAFYSEHVLVYITPIVALSFTLNLGVAHRAILERRLAFREVAAVEIVSAVISVAVTLTAALAGAGAFALATGPLAQSAALSLGYWTRVRWRPHRVIARDSFRRIWRFSAGLLGFNTVNYWSRNADNLLIGRVLGATSLGYYSRAYNLMLLPVTQVTQVLSRVMLPALSSMGDDPLRIASAYRRTVRTTSAVLVPFLVLVAAAAPGLVRLLWGPQWTGAVDLLQILCIAGIPQCMNASVGWLYQSQGRTATMFRVGLWTSAVGVAAIAVGLAVGGAVGVAWAILLRVWLLTPVTLMFATRVIGLRASRVILDNLPTLAIAAFVGGAVWLLPLVVGVDRDRALVAAVQGALGAAAYIALTRLTRPQLFAEVRQQLGGARRG